MGQHEDTTHDMEEPAPRLRGQPALLLLFCGTTPLGRCHAIPLPVDGVTFGRTAVHVHPILSEDNRMSREHARVRWNPLSGAVHVVDLHSRNGTFVNGSQIQEATLRDGDVLRMGNTLLLLRCDDPPFARGIEAPVGPLLGDSGAMVRVRSKLARVAPSTASLLLLGPTGTGKEVAARYVHDLSRRKGPFLAVNCSAIPESLAESQLFGHTKGAFTGASEHLGLFRAAQGGTLLLDEIGDLSERIQPKLLRVLEEHTVTPVGAVVSQPMDVRMLFATNCNLLDAVQRGKFRADLYARIAEVVIDLPPLSERREDILRLMLSVSRTGMNRPLNAGLAEALLLHDWPFNVRELVKLVAEWEATDDASGIEQRLRRQRSAGVAPTLRADSVSPGVAPTTPASATPASATPASATPVSGERRPQRDALHSLLRTYNGNVAAIARRLGCPRKYIYRWLEEYGMELDTYRA